MIKVYGPAKSRAFRVLWALELFQMEHELVDIDFTKGEHRGAEFLAINPLGKVPVIEHKGKIIHESLAIMLYIHDMHCREQPDYDQTIDRCQLYQWLFFVAAELEQGLWLAARNTFIYPQEQRIPEAIVQGQKNFADLLPFVAEQLGSKPFLLGESLSVADIAVCQTLLWGKQQQKLDVNQGNLADYLGRCRSSESFQNTANRYRGD